MFENRKLLVEVAREKRQQRDDRQDDVADERVGAGSEGGGEAVARVSDWGVEVCGVGVLR